MRIGPLLLTCALSTPLNAAIAIPGTLAYPKAPPELPVFNTAVDDSINDRITGRIKPVHKTITGANGEVSMFVTALPAAPAGPPDPVVDRGVAKAFFNTVLPADETLRELGARFTKVSQRFHSNGTIDRPHEESSVIRMDRYIDFEHHKYRVYGEGSAAVAEVRDEVVASVVRWKRVTGRTMSVTRPLNEAVLDKALNAEFPAIEGYDVGVTGSPELAYYDDQTRIVPVYRVTTTVNRHDGLHSDQQDVFIPAVVGVTLNTPAVMPEDAAGTCAEPAPQMLNARTITVDRYAARGDRSEWIGNARRFIAGLQQAPFVPRNFCILESRMLAASPGYVDGANVVLIEAHGDPGCVQAQNCVPLSDAQGYGNQNDGLQLLILHSCRVIETSDDNSLHWSERWWTIFKGVHTVLGYRATISRSDGVSTAYATRLTNDEPMIRAWLMEAAVSKAYSEGSTNGLPAAITVFGHENDRRSQLTQLQSPESLVAYWLRN
jgi:hypothetical protein